MTSTAISITHLIRSLTGAHPVPRLEVVGGDALFSGVSFEGHTKPGDLYINLYGAGSLGQAKLLEAITKGAAAVCCEMKPEKNLGVPVCLIDEPRVVMAHAAALLHGFPSRSLQLCGVTGSNGKSTVAAMLTRCLSAARIPNGCLFSEGQKIGEVIHPATHTTPDAPLLHRRLAEMVDAGVRHGVLEVSSHGIAQRRLDDVDVHSAIVTNISLEHTEFHPSMDHYIQTKARLFAGLPENGFAVYYADDPSEALVAHDTNAFRVGVGEGTGADVHMSDGALHFGPRLAGRAGRKPDQMPLVLQVPGRHERLNAAMVAAMAFAWGIPVEVIQRALAGYPGLPRRNKIIFRGRFTAVYCMSYNPQSLEAMHDIVNKHWRLSGHLVHVCTVRANRGTVMNAAIATKLAEVIRRLGGSSVIVSSVRDSLRSDFMAGSEETEAFLNALRDARMDFEYYPDLKPAVDAGLSRMRRGSSLILAGSDNINEGADYILEVLPRYTNWLDRKLHPPVVDHDLLRQCLTYPAG